MASQFPSPAVPLIEPCPVPDTFCTGLARAEVHGNIIHFILYAEHCDAEGRIERVIVARILMPKESVPAAVRMALHAVSNDYIDRYMPDLFKFAS